MRNNESYDFGENVATITTGWRKYNSLRQR